MHEYRNYTLFDRLALSFDQALRAILNNPKTSGVSYPAKAVEEAEMSETQRKHSAALMRVNHAGEICAQALYHGQALVSRSKAVREKMEMAAIEEGDHLAWCKQRLEELNNRTSLLTPFWYFGSYLIGVSAGLIADDLSLGFVAETERQVVKHLEGHIKALRDHDPRSYAILQQMEKDEAMHRDEAMMQGAAELPEVVKKLMAMASKVMVKTAYWV